MIFLVSGDLIEAIGAEALETLGMAGVIGVEVDVVPECPEYFWDTYERSFLTSQWYWSSSAHTLCRGSKSLG